MRARGITAWLLEWEGEGAPPRLAAILSARLAPSLVAEIVESWYANTVLPMGDRLRYANQKRVNRFPVRRDRPRRSSRGEQITCGPGPRLCARIVRNLRVAREADGAERLRWDEVR